MGAHTTPEPQWTEVGYDQERYESDPAYREFIDECDGVVANWREGYGDAAPANPAA